MYYSGHVGLGTVSTSVSCHGGDYNSMLSYSSLYFTPSSSLPWRRLQFYAELFQFILYPIVFLWLILFANQLWPYSFFYCLVKDSMGPRWKGKGAEAEANAKANPMSIVLSTLKSCLLRTNSRGILSSCSVLFNVDMEEANLLNKACFGRPIITSEKDKHWFQLSMEEAFYLSYSLRCIKIVGENDVIQNEEKLWKYMLSKRKTFPDTYKAYSHLRGKNWVVRSGSQYGMDFVAYRHHPSLVHSEYAVLVLSDEEGDVRLRVWSDFECSLRLCGSVAKTLLVLYINRNGKSDDSPLCLESYSVEERTITRWSPEQCREDRTVPENGTK